MPPGVLTLLKLCLVAVLYLFFFRVIRAVWAELRDPGPPAAPQGATVLRTTTAAVATPVAAPPVAVAPSAATEPRLTVTAPPALAGQTFALSGQEQTVGRAPGCAVLLGDPTVSSVHARLGLQGGRVVVEDLQSRNGTFVNGSRINGTTPLGRGDRLGIGPVVTLEVR